MLLIGSRRCARPTSTSGSLPAFRAAFDRVGRRGRSKRNAVPGGAHRADGDTDIYATGVYLDVYEIGDGQARLNERTVVVRQLVGSTPGWRCRCEVERRALTIGDPNASDPEIAVKAAARLPAMAAVPDPDRRRACDPLLCRALRQMIFRSIVLSPAAPMIALPLRYLAVDALTEAAFRPDIVRRRRPRTVAYVEAALDVVKAGHATSIVGARIGNQRQRRRHTLLRLPEPAGAADNVRRTKSSHAGPRRPAHCACHAARAAAARLQRLRLS